MIHNGIIENYSTIRTELENKGYTFRSNTDTEVIVYLVEYIQQTNHVDLCTAVQLALHQIVGAYAIAVIEKGNPNCIIAARKSSPLVIGIGDNEFFLASDATPIIEYTDKVVYLNDEEIAKIERDKPLKIKNLKNVIITPQIKKLAMNLSQLEKGGYPHFMLKEIYEQPKTLIIIVACGTSWHAALIGEYLIEDWCRIPVEVEYASEFRYRNPVIHADDVVIAISQSGETADTLAAVELARSKGAFIYGICKVVGSSIARATHSGSYIHVGPEIGVASTKAFTGQVTVLSMLALTIAKEKGSIPHKKYEEKVQALKNIPALLTEVLKQSDKIKELSKIFTYAHNFIYLGRGYNYPAALEGALKLKEISYIHAEGYPAAEMKHGPIALIDTEMPVVVIATADRIYEKTISNIQEIKARKGKIIAIVTEGDTIVKNIADVCIEVPKTIEEFEPIVSSIPLQLLAYFIAVNKGRDVDQPRNLAKSVTVE